MYYLEILWDAKGGICMNKRQRKKLEVKKKFKLPNVPQFTPVERWNMFHTLSVYIAAGLRTFLSYKIYGVPAALTDDEHYTGERLSKEYLEELKEEVNELIEERNLVLPFNRNEKVSEEMKNWRNIILKMLWSFEQIRDDYPDSPFNKWHDKQFWGLLDKGILPMELEKADENGLSKVKFNGEETPQEIWDEDNVYYEKIQEGLDLFAKHFRSLWD